MASRLDVSLVVKVAKMYYLDGLKQEDISKQIGISRSLISMILTEAKETGIVEITIRDPFLNDDALCARFSKSFPGVSFAIVPTSSRDPDALRKLVAQRAADIVEHALAGGEVVALAWGRTCHEFVNSYREDPDKKDVSVVPLIGGSFQTAPYFQINEMVRRFAEKIGGSPNFIHAPALALDVKEQDMYMNSSSLQAIREQWKRMDVVVSGIGALPTTDDNDRETYAGEFEISGHFAPRKVAGDICARYFLSDGEFVRDDYYDRIVGAPVEELLAAKKTVCMASGAGKAEAVVGALRTGVVKTLVMDEPTAKAVFDAIADKLP
jgi:deoxyribonucleoside regulator